MNIMQKTIFLIAGLLIAGTAYAELSVANWQYVKTIQLPGEHPYGSYAKVGIDRDVSIHAQPDLRDLRVVANGSQEVPYQLAVENESVRNEYAPTLMTDLASKGGETMFILDLSARGILHNHLVITTPSKNFKRKVSVYAADAALTHSDPSWRKLTDTGYIYNFSDDVSGFNAGSGVVSYPPSTAQYLRVVIGAGEGSPVSVTSANVFRVAQISAREDRFTIPAMITQNTERKTTEITADLGASGLPTHRITLATNDTKNFDRRAIMQSSSDGKNWYALGDGYVFHLRTPRFSGDQLMLSYPENTSRYLRVLIMNADDTPVAWESAVTVESIARSLVFLPEAGTTYTLYYGNVQAMAPQYDLGRYLQYFESVMLPDARLGAELSNPAYLPPKVVPPPDPAKGVEVLDVVLILLVAIVASLTLFYLRKLKMDKHA